MSDPAGAPADRPLACAERAARFERVDTFLARATPARPDQPARRHRAGPDRGNPAVWRPYPRGPGGAACCPNCGRDEAPF